MILFSIELIDCALELCYFLIVIDDGFEVLSSGYETWYIIVLHIQKTKILCHDIVANCKD